MPRVQSDGQRYQPKELTESPLGDCQCVRDITNRLDTAQDQYFKAEDELRYATANLNDLGDAIRIGNRWVSMAEGDIPPYPFLAKVDRPLGSFEADTVCLIAGSLDWYGFVGDGEITPNMYYWGR